MDKRVVEASEEAPVTTPELSESQKRRLKRLVGQVNDIKIQIADLELRKSQLIMALSNQQGALQEAIRSAMQASGVDFEEGPKGSWSLDLETMKITFDPAHERPPN